MVSIIKATILLPVYSFRTLRLCGHFTALQKTYWVALGLKESR